MAHMHGHPPYAVHGLPPHPGAGHPGLHHHGAPGKAGGVMGHALMNPHTGALVHPTMGSHHTATINPLTGQVSQVGPGSAAAMGYAAPAVTMTTPRGGHMSKLISPRGTRGGGREGDLQRELQDLDAQLKEKVGSVGFFPCSDGFLHGMCANVHGRYPQNPQAKRRSRADGDDDEDMVDHNLRLRAMVDKLKTEVSVGNFSRVDRGPEHASVRDGTT